MNRRPPRLSSAPRHLGRALVLAILGAILASVVTSTKPQVPSATTRVAVSDEVEWPFYASAREQLLEIAEQPEIIAAVRDELGVGTTSIELTAEATGGEIMVELTAEAEDADVAIAAANLYAEEIVAASARQNQEEQVRPLEDLEARILEIADRIQENDLILGELGTAVDQLGDDPSNSDRAVLQSQIERIQSAQREDARVQTALVQDLNAGELTLAQSGSESDFSVIRRADSADDGSLLDPTVIALLVGIPLFLLGLGVSVLWDQTYGLLRHADDVRWVSEAPVVTVRCRGSGDDAEITAGNSMVRRVSRHQSRGSQWLMIPLGNTTEQLSRRLAAIVSDGLGSDDHTTCRTNESATGHNASQPSRPASLSESSGSGTNVDSSRSNGDTIVRSSIEEKAVPNTRLVVGRLPSLETATAAAVSGGVLVFTRGRLRVQTLLRAVEELETEGLPLEAIVMFDEQPR